MFADQKIQNSKRPDGFYTKSEECIHGGLEQFYSISEGCCSSCSNIALCIESVNGEKNRIQKQCSLTAVLKNDCGGDDLDSDSLHYKKCQQHLLCKNKYNQIHFGSKLQDDLLNYKKELREYNNTTKDLEEKYKKLNIELNEMQKSHERFITNQKSSSPKTSSLSLTAMHDKESEYSLKSGCTDDLICKTKEENIASRKTSREELYCPFHLKHSYAEDKSKMCGLAFSLGSTAQAEEFRNKSSHKSVVTGCNTENISKLSSTSISSGNNKTNMRDLYSIVQSVLNTNESAKDIKEEELKFLQAKVNNLQNEHAHFKDIIDQQKDCLRDYHSRCLKAQYILKSQQIQIEKLNSNNQQLETEITKGIDDLRTKIDIKLKDISKLPQIMREEQQKYEKISKENTALAERLKCLQDEAQQLKIKVEELAKKKAGTINRLKNTEKDLKIFKNYNIALKHEKRRLCDELQKVKEQLDTIQNSSKRSISRQREQSEKQRRDLQKKLFELELKLSRSKNSTTSLIQERDNLIAELQTQLNTLVHNFEVSQKHIRVLRRHIYSMTGTNPL